MANRLVLPYLHIKMNCWVTSAAEAALQLLRPQGIQGVWQHIFFPEWKWILPFSGHEFNEFFKKMQVNHTRLLGSPHVQICSTGCSASKHCLYTGWLLNLIQGGSSTWKIILLLWHPWLEVLEQASSIESGALLLAAIEKKIWVNLGHCFEELFKMASNPRVPSKV